MYKKELETGQVWYVKIPGSVIDATLSTVMIMDLSKKTVALDHAIWNRETKEYDPYSKQYNSDLHDRYKITDIEFVERVA